jgi:hypothetical protein
MFRCITLLLVLLLAPCFPSTVLADNGEGVTLLVKSSPLAKDESQYYINSKLFTKQLLKAQKINTNENPELPYAYLKIGDKKDTYIVSYSLNLYNPEKQVKWIPSTMVKNQLNTYIGQLREHHFGKPLPWKEAKNVFPRMGYASVKDLETGLVFAVQRRAGSRHADVQPLTAKDTKIMKEIYDGKWSWKRRAILLKTNGQVMAASMNGMPHGAGAISGNDFPGHFCIHFKDSTTHKKNHADPGHDYMVLKASGKLIDHLVTGDTKMICSSFISALHEKDVASVPLFLNQAEWESNNKFLHSLENIEAIKLEEVPTNQQIKTGELEEELSTILRYKLVGQKEQKKTVVFHFSRLSATDRWILTIEPLMDQLGL